MESEITWIEPSLVSVRNSGLASVEGFAAVYERLAAEPGFGPGVKILSDHTALDISQLKVGDIEEIAALRDRYARSLAARSALVVGSSSPVKYGLGRMFEAFSADEPEGLIRVFETSDEALAWLQDDNTTTAPPIP
jgi:hypothetical protein